MNADVVIVGAGLAGIYTALMLPKELNIVIVSKGSHKETNSYLAQGGIAAAMTSVNDSPQMHFEDTLKSGRYTNNHESVRVLVEEAEMNMHKLESLGVVFDHDANGAYLFGMEGAHSLARILRIGDHTGRSVMEVLEQRAVESENIHWIKAFYATDLIVSDEICYGVEGFHNEAWTTIYAKKTLLATGGVGHLYSYTSNIAGIDGSGIALAIRAGVQIDQMNKTQFHPTVFYSKNQEGRQFLISEAVRGEGALLLNQKGERFMPKYDDRLELAPRDVVSSAIESELRQQDLPFVYLDVTHLSKAFLMERFPTIYEFCASNDLFMEKDRIPVSPRLHYFMGGIKTNLNGQTSMKNLYAAGECAFTGVHGSNRLASNSLLEAVVFGNRVAKDIGEMIRDDESVIQIYSNQTKQIPKYNVALETLKVWMDDVMGINREQDKLMDLKRNIKELLERPVAYQEVNIEDIRTYNALLMMKEMVNDALKEFEAHDEV